MIRVSAMIKAHRFLTSLGSGYTISPIKWDSSKQCVKKGSFNSRGLSYAEINNRINAVASEFQSLEAEVLNGRPISKDTLKNLWLSKFSKNTKDKKTSAADSSFDKFDNSLFGLYNRFMAEEGKVRNWRPEIKAKFEFAKKQLQHFSPNLQFEDVTKEMLADFCTFLVDKYDLVNETVLKKVVDIRQFFRWAIDNDIISSSPIMKFKPKLTTAKRPVIYLEWEELMAVNNLKFTEDEQRHEHIRDCFVFLCFTGMRHSDLQNLKKTDIRGNSIFITTIKTSDALEIQLNKHSKAILKKYKDTKLPKDKGISAKDTRAFQSPGILNCKKLLQILNLLGFILVDGHRPRIGQNSVHTLM